MVSLPPRPEVITVTSETLQSKIRQLLPSQMGFGSDLAAQNVIVPIIDLTASAEGSDVSQNLQTAFAFGSQTSGSTSNTTDTIINTTGFYRILVSGYAAASGLGTIDLSDGVTDKTIWRIVGPTGGSTTKNEYFDAIIFLAAGESLKTTANATTIMAYTSRQIADVNGTLIQPSGFTPQ